MFIFGVWAILRFRKELLVTWLIWKQVLITIELVHEHLEAEWHSYLRQLGLFDPEFSTREFQVVHWAHWLAVRTSVKDD